MKREMKLIHCKRENVLKFLLVVKFCRTGWICFSLQCFFWIFSSSLQELLKSQWGIDPGFGALMLCHWATENTKMNQTSTSSLCTSLQSTAKIGNVERYTRKQTRKMMNLELCHEIKRTQKSEFFLLFLFFFFTITVLRDFPNVKRYPLTRIIRKKLRPTISSG